MTDTENEHRLALVARIDEAKANLKVVRARVRAAERMVGPDRHEAVSAAHRSLTVAEMGVSTANYYLLCFNNAQAEDRSVALLRRIIGDWEYDMYKSTGVLHVRGSDGVVYTLSRPGPYNIIGRGCQYCVQLRRITTATDILIGQVLWLKANAEGLIKRANAR